MKPPFPLSPLPAGWHSLSHAFLRRARACPQKTAIADTTGTSLTYRETLLRSFALGRVLARSLGSASHVGLLIPPTAPAILANLAITLWGKVPVNLNYTSTQEIVDSCVSQCGMTHVLTSRRALSKFPLKPNAELIFLEDIPKKVTTADKAFAASAAHAIPVSLLSPFLPGLRGHQLDKPATVMFTSGSTGEPKGVILSQSNILHQVHQIDQHVRLAPEEVVLGVLPFFHSFGFTVTIWTALCLGKKAVYHFNPLDARIVGNLAVEHRASMIAASPTFMRHYAKKCDREQFATMRLAILGAEKLKPEVAEEIRERLGVEPLEGYGCTETGPCVSVNIPDDRKTPDGRVVSGNRPGTVGMLLPGTMVRTIDPSTGDELPQGTEGIVLVKGPQVMTGYLNRPETTARVLSDGWYNTGDLGRLDNDGFLTITGRISRFSKIGGEMVPHEGVESAILSVASCEHPHVAVTSVSDPKRGERLVVIYDDLGATAPEIHRLLLASSLPKLWIPGPDDFVQVPSIPILGSGKVDLRQVRLLAEQYTQG